MAQEGTAKLFFRGRREQKVAFPPRWLAPGSVGSCRAHVSGLVSARLSGGLPCDDPPPLGRADTNRDPNPSHCCACRRPNGSSKTSGRLFSPLSLSVCAGQVVFRAALQQNYDRGAWRYGGVSLMSLFSPEACLCHVLSVSLGSFCACVLAARAAGHTGRGSRLPSVLSLGFRD